MTGHVDADTYHQTTTARDTKREDTYDMTNGTDGPLDGLVVLEAGSTISGLTIGRFVTDFGATIIKIEHPAFGDHIRRFGPQKDNIGLWHKYLLRDKQPITLNISTDEDMVVFEDLMGETDLLTGNFRPGTLERWNVGWEHLSEINGDLVILWLSGFGQTGPYSEHPGFETLAEAISGFTYLSGFPDSSSLFLPIDLADNIVALFSMFMVMFALYHRDIHGGGSQYIGTSLIEPVSGLLGSQLLRYNQLGATESQSGNRSASSAPQGVYWADDDRQVVISASTRPFTEWTFDAIGRPDLKDDPRSEINGGRLEHIDELNAIAQDQMDDHSHEEVLDAFEAADATLASVYNVKDILNDEHYAAYEAPPTIDDPDLGEAVVQGAFPKFSEAPERADHLGPSFDEHNDVVYHDRLGYDESVLLDFEAEDVI